MVKYHPARADVGMAHLAVAHLALRQAHVQTGGRELRVGVLLEKLVQAGGIGRPDSVALRLIGQAEAVHDD